MKQTNFRCWWTLWMKSNIRMQFKAEKLLEVGRVVKEGLQTAGIWIETWVRNGQIFTNQKKELPGTERASQFKCTSCHSLLKLLEQSLVTQLCPTLCDPMDWSMPGFPVLNSFLEFAQTHVHWINNTIQQSHLLSPPSPVLNVSQHQDLFQWVYSLHQVAKGLELQLQNQSFQWIFKVDFL